MTNEPKPTPRELAGLIEQQRHIVAAESAALKDLEARFTEAMLGEAASEFSEAGKEEGEVTFHANGMKVRAEAKKTVRWNSDKLKEIAADMPWSTAERLFDIKFGMKETTYKAIPDEALRAKINEARTTKVGDLQVKFLGFEDQ